MKLNFSAISTIALATAFLIGEGVGGSPAHAADLGMKDSGAVSDNAPARQVNWTGFYVAVQGGYGNADHKLTVQQYQDTFADRCLTGPNVTNDTVGTCAGNGHLQIGQTGDSTDLANIDGINSSGFIGGGRIGYDRQLGSRFLVGLFGEYNFSNMKTTANVIDNGSASLEKNGEWSLGGRAGLLLDNRTLAYIMAAYTQTDYDLKGLSAPKKFVDQDRFSTGATFTGATVGVGIEHAIASNVFLGLEYGHTFYGTETIFDQYDAICNNGTRVKDALDEDKVMGRITVKLNGDIFGN